LFESFLIVISIMVALALDEWRGTRQDDEMIRQALLSFASEIGQNQARIEDAAPFNQGLLNVLEQRYAEDDIADVDEFVNMVEIYTPVVLQSTAWETALATGSLAKMNYDMVSALSLTYSLQSRYQAATSTGMDEVMRPHNLSPDQMNLAIVNSIRYLNSATSMEAELSVVYNEATAVIGAAVNLPDREPGAAAVYGQD
jgi:hypothetical protein